MDSNEKSVELHLLHGYNSTSTKTQLMYNLLFESLKSKDIKTFKSIVEQNLRKQPPVLNLNSPLPNTSGETLLDLACKSGRVEFVEYLLKKGAEVNRVNEAHNRAPIHFATESRYEDVLRVLLDESTINPNLEAGQQTALHIAVKNNDLNCANILLERNASPNIPNSKGLTALHMAGMKGQRHMVNLILEKSRHTVHLDKYKDYNKQTTREVLQKKLPDISLPGNQWTTANVHDLKYYLNANDEGNFLKCLDQIFNDVEPTLARELIEISVRRNFGRSVNTLLEKVNGTDCNLETAVNIAIQEGRPNILRKLLNTDCYVGDHLVLYTCMELGVPGSRHSGSMDDRVECVKLVLDRDDADIRSVDNKGNTPLHYAARANCREVVKLLLEQGSYIGQMNYFGVPPVADIPAPTLSQYFDDCLRANRRRTNEYTIEFDYTCLMPCDPSHYMTKEHNDTCARGEMGVLYYIASHSGLKHLLKHPLLSSFLHLKWRKIRHLLFLNFVLYVLFCLLLNLYIIHTIYESQDQASENGSAIGNSSESRDNSIKSVSTYGMILKSFTALALIFLIIRESLQLLSAPCYYVRKVDNWVEVVLIGLGIAVLSGTGPPISAIAILLSAWELVTLMGQYPRMSTGIEMFKKVSINFIRFFFLYGFLLLAFALAFFAIFKEDEEFPNPGHALFKTIIMLTGEFEAKELPYVYHPVLSRLIFVLFVFFIAIVLFNLLNGLAVSDTAEILSKVELVGLISRTQLVTYAENMAVRTPSRHNKNCFLCQDSHLPTCNPLGFLVRKILLFPNYLRNGKLCVAPDMFAYDYDTKEYEHQHETVFGDDEKDKIVPCSQIDPHIIKRAKEILSRKCEESDTEKILSQLEIVKDQLSRVELELHRVKFTLDNNNFNNSGEDRITS